MKCPHCGGEIGLEEKYCSWCGKPNEQSVRHHEDMERFQAAWRDTEKTVEKKTKHVVRLLPRLIVILVLVLVSAAAGIIGSRAWDFADSAKRRASERNAAEVCAALDEYLEMKDYKGFDSYSELHCLNFYSGPFEDYSAIHSCASCYATFLTHLEEIFLQRDREKWLKDQSSFDIRYLSSAIDDFFSNLTYLQRRDLMEKDERCLEDMRQTAEGMIRVFLGMDEEQLRDFLDMTENRQAVYLEEVITGA